MLSKISNLLQKDDASTVPENSIAVLPFKQIEGNDRNRYFGLALADAVATRLSQNASVAIRPPSTFLSLSDHAIWEIEAGQKLQTEYVLTGSFFSDEEGFSLNWQLVQTDSQTIIPTSSTAVPKLDLVPVQSERKKKIFKTLSNVGKLDQYRQETSFNHLPIDLSELYIEAQALLTSFLRC